jgi:lipopolysaccharide transport system permease protein
MKTIISAQQKGLSLNLAELYHYRELLWTLTYRDIRVKYAQTTIGFLWAFLNPILTLLVLSFVFGVVAKVETTGSDGQTIPHLLYTTAGMCGWTYFSTVLAEGGNSILVAQGMVKKIYFPRLVLPLSKAITAFIDFGIIFGCMLLMMLWYGFWPSWEILYLPFFLLMAILAGLSAGIWMSALTIRFRDFQHIIPLLLRLGMYATPIAYPASAVPEKYQLFFYLNPVAGIVEGMRWSLLGGSPPAFYAYVSFAVVAVLFVLGLFYFKKVERIMADVL